MIYIMYDCGDAAAMRDTRTRNGAIGVPRSTAIVDMFNIIVVLNADTSVSALQGIHVVLSTRI